MSPESYILSFMGAVGLYLLNCIRNDNRDLKREIKELWKEVGDHLQDRRFHTKCGKEEK